MSETIYESDFVKYLPQPLTHDPKMIALARVAAKELLEVSGLAKTVLIYSRIDELPEEMLDILAYDLHVDWYDYTYTLETKRNVLKSSVGIHKKMGTKYAVETALQDVYKTAKVEEWFEYGGEPYTFRVHVAVGNNGLTEGADREIARNMQFYKNIRSHCTGICYRLGVQKGTVKTGAAQKVGSSIKVKPYLVKNIKADAAEGSLRAYLKNENIMTIRKEQ